MVETLLGLNQAFSVVAQLTPGLTNFFMARDLAVHCGTMFTILASTYEVPIAPLEL